MLTPDLARSDAGSHENLFSDTPDLDLLRGRRFALALSGGGDSLALLKHLKDHPGLAAVLIVDHGLRPGSAAEAVRAKRLSHRLGHEGTVLTWHPDGQLSTGLQAKARTARYGLLGQACRERGLKYLVTAHHADDQAETVLMRLERGSGWRGAAGMRAQTYAPVWPELADVTLLRPALYVSSDPLRSALGDLTSIEDPSNQEARFTRVRARRALADNSKLRTEMLKLATDMARGVEVERATIKTDIEPYELTEQGEMILPEGPRYAATLARLAPIIGGQSGPADRQRIRAALRALEAQKTVNLGYGCIASWRQGALHLSRDPVAMTGRRDGNLPPTAVPMSITQVPRVWDGRFLISGEGGVIHPVRHKRHVGFTVEGGQNVCVRPLIEDRLTQYLAGM